jgi:cytochrome P450
VSDYEGTDFFLGRDLLVDPYPYFESLRAKGELVREPFHEVVMVTGYDEALEIYNDTERFSSCTSVTGPFPGFTVPLEGYDDISDLIAQHRDELPMSDQLPTLDPPIHGDHRSLLMRLITPKRLKENEEFMWRLADRQLDTFLETGRCDWVNNYAGPFAMLVIADLLGVPEEDRPGFSEALLSGKHSGSIGSTKGESLTLTPLEYLYRRFTDYIEDRRANPRGDVLTGLAEATFPDGSTPDALDVVRVAANLFAAGQETTVRLLSSAVQLIAEDADIQAQLRANRELIPNFIEESLRTESPVKGDFRLSKVPVTIGGVDLPAGTTVMLVNAAINRDPRHFDDPGAFKIDRPNARTHVSFGRGVHTCPGAPLARAEARVSLERLLDRTEDIRIDESQHGPAGARSYRYVPTFILRGLTHLHLELTPKETPAR